MGMNFKCFRFSNFRCFGRFLVKLVLTGKKERKRRGKKKKKHKLTLRALFYSVVKTENKPGAQHLR